MSEKINTTVSEVMTTDIITINATATVHDATELMRVHKTSSIVVNRRDDADEFGLVVVSDIASKVLALNLSPKRVNVYEIMSKPLITVPAEMNIVFAMRLLSRFQLSRAVVIDHDRNPLGIVTVRDMVLRNIQEVEAE
jgi:predicted transcriptional regulator